MKPKELTIRGLILGALITTIFTAGIGIYLPMSATFAVEMFASPNVYISLHFPHVCRSSQYSIPS